MTLAAQKTVDLGHTAEAMEAIIEQLPQTQIPDDLEGSTWAAAMGNLKKQLEEGKLFVCLVAAWNMMLSEEQPPKQQREMDLSGFGASIDAQCPQSFPATVMQLLNKWAEGSDVATLVP